MAAQWLNSSWVSAKKCRVVFSPLVLRVNMRSMQTRNGLTKRRPWGARNRAGNMTRQTLAQQQDRAVSTITQPLKKKLQVSYHKLSCNDVG